MVVGERTGYVSHSAGQGGGAWGQLGVDGGEWWLGPWDGPALG